MDKMTTRNLTARDIIAKRNEKNNDFIKDDS